MEYQYTLAPNAVVNVVADALLDDKADVQNMLDQYAKGRTVTVAGTTYNVYVKALREVLLSKGWTPAKRKEYKVTDVTL